MVFPKVPRSFYVGAIILRYRGRELKNQDTERGKACGKDDDNSASMCKATAILIVEWCPLYYCRISPPDLQHGCNVPAQEGRKVLIYTLGSTVWTNG